MSTNFALAIWSVFLLLCGLAISQPASGKPEPIARSSPHNNLLSPRASPKKELSESHCLVSHKTIETDATEFGERAGDVAGTITFRMPVVEGPEDLCSVTLMGMLIRICGTERLLLDFEELPTVTAGRSESVMREPVCLFRFYFHVPRPHYGYMPPEGYEPAVGCLVRNVNCMWNNGRQQPIENCDFFKVS